jgi:hypothetical protein
MVASLYNPPSAVDTVTDLQSFDGNALRANSIVSVFANISGGRSPRTYQFIAGNVAVDVSSQLVLPPAVNPAGGKWLLVDQFTNLEFAVDFNRADAAVIFTVPAGFRLRMVRPMLEVGTPWTGGAASSIGISSSNANYNTKGDLMGAAAGDVAAGLTAGFRGTLGTKLAGSTGPVVLIAGDTVRFDRIVSIFTAGNGVLHLPVEQIL